MTFFRVSPHYIYTLSGCVLDSNLTYAADLAVYMEPKLKFSDHLLQW